MSDDERQSFNITDSLIILSIGFNDPIDSIIDDLNIGFTRFQREHKYY